MQKKWSVVTGGAGFIGSHLTRMLLTEGKAVRVLDNLSTGRLENLEGLADLYPDSFELVEGDIRDFDLVRSVLAGSEFVFHQAAIPSVQQSVEDTVVENQVNVDGTLNVLVAARDEKDVKKFVYATSCAVYGESEVLPKLEDMPVEPLSPYAASKCVNELYARVFSEVYGLETIGLRYFNVYGPRQDPNSDYAAVIPKFVTRMLNSAPPLIFGDGKQTRDFIYVGSVARANILAAESGASGCILNIGSGKRFNLLELVAEINQILGTDLDPVFEPARSGEVRHSLADIGRAGEAIGFEVDVDFRRGLEMTIDWFRTQM